jgi:F-type H+-transporting ATPase subunit b
VDIVAIARVFAEGGEAANPFGNLGINTALIIAQIINFIFLWVFLNSLVVQPVLASLEKRRKSIDESLENARKADERLANVEKDYQAKLAEASVDAQKQRAETLAAASSEAQRIRAEAVTEVDKVKAQARVDATVERNQMLAESRSQIVSLVMAATNKLVGESLDATRQKSLINDFFAKVPAGVASTDGAKVSVTSALPLSAEEQARVKSELKVSDIEFSVDPGILGGLVVRVGDKIIDGSVQSKVGSMRQALSA